MLTLADEGWREGLRVLIFYYFFLKMEIVINSVVSLFLCVFCDTRSIISSETFLLACSSDRQYTLYLSEHCTDFQWRR